MSPWRFADAEHRIRRAPLCGVFYPGSVSVEEMSSDDIIDYTNSSGADFLVASLGPERVNRGCSATVTVSRSQSGLTWVL